LGCPPAAASASRAWRTAYAAAWPQEEGPRRRVSAHGRTAYSPSDVVAGFLATVAIFGSCIALVYRPVRIIPFMILLALIAAGMGSRNQRLAAIALAISGACFIVGTFFAIITNHPIF
jgi:hypothetical protein